MLFGGAHWFVSLCVRVYAFGRLYMLRVCASARVFEVERVVHTQMTRRTCVREKLYVNRSPAKRIVNCSMAHMRARSMCVGWSFTIMVVTLPTTTTSSSSALSLTSSSLLSCRVMLAVRVPHEPGRYKLYAQPTLVSKSRSSTYQRSVLVYDYNLSYREW